MNTFRVGLLTLFAIGCLGYMSLKITAGKSDFGDYIKYKAILSDAAGIFTKSQIKVAGINAGRIVDIKLKGSEAVLEFEVLDTIKVTETAVLKVKSVGFLGDKYLDIDLGDANSERLAADSFIRAESSGGFDKVGENAGEVLRLVKEALNKDGENVLRQIFENTKKVTENLDQITATLKRITTGKEERLDEIVENLAQISRQLAYETNGDREGSLAERLKRVGPILDDVKVVVADIREGKGSVGKLLRDDYVVDQLSNTLSGVNRIVNRINNITADISIYGGATTKGESDTRMDVDLYPAPERFFRLGVASNSFGPEDREITETTDTVAGVSTVSRKVVVTEESFKFNGQIGRHFGNWAFRVGLFETTGGLAVDYNHPQWGSRFSAEAFDYDKDFGPYVRLVSEWKLWNVIYTRLTGEDLVSKRNNAALNVQLGVRFTDRDIASLFGFLIN